MLEYAEKYSLMVGIYFLRYIWLEKIPTFMFNFYSVTRNRGISWRKSHHYIMSQPHTIILIIIMIIIPRAKRVYILAARAKLDAPNFYLSFLLMNIWLVPANDVMYLYVMKHFAFPGNIDFGTNNQGAFSCFIHEKLMCLFIVCETVFTLSLSLCRGSRVEVNNFFNLFFLFFEQWKTNGKQIRRI